MGARAIGAVVVGAAILAAGGASADVNLLTGPSIRLDGAVAGDAAGTSVGNAGDVNGDGRPDAIVGAPDAGNNGRPGSGSAYVVFGQASTSSIDFANLGSRGFRIDGAVAGDRAGIAVAGGGDVNGDGLADVLVGASGADFNGRADSGSAYVVYGKAGTSAVDLASLGSQGYRVDGRVANGHAGTSVAGAGDVNGDGRADAVVGAPFDDSGAPTRMDAGTTFVVFGLASPAGIDLNSLGAGGYRIDGATAEDLAGISVGNAGDANGDGKPDAIVGASGLDPSARSLAGGAYVVFGKASTTTVDLASLGTGGYRVDGAAAGARAGGAVAGAGDVNGDGRDDVVIGAVAAGNNGRTDSGSAYIVFGQTATSTIDLASLGSLGFRIDGAAASDNAGAAVAGAGDVNGDNRRDLLVGASGADNNGRPNSGSAYLVHGQASTSTIDLQSLSTAQGFRIDGAAGGDELGIAVAGAGDGNGDGRNDQLVGARSADNNARSVSGSAYVVLGAPVISTGASSGITETAATLNGSVSTNGESSTYRFDYGTTTTYGSQTTSVSAGSGLGPITVSSGISGLAASTTYHYRLVVSSASGTLTGSDASFTTGLNAPEAATGGSSSIAQTSATVAGSVNPRGSSTTYRFEYGTTTSYGSQTATVSAGFGGSTVSVSASLTGLAAGTLYHYRLVATNTAGSVNGADRTFTTASSSSGAPGATPPSGAATPPIVTTGGASVVGESSSTVTATVNPNGAATTYRFEYGTTTTYGSQSATFSAGSGTSAVSVSTVLVGLTPARRYHYRVVAANVDGTSAGADRTFVTLDPSSATGSGGGAGSGTGSGGSASPPGTTITAAPAARSGTVTVTGAGATARGIRVGWERGAFGDRNAQVAVTPAPRAVGGTRGFAAGVAAVEVIVTDAVTGEPIRTFEGPLDIDFLAAPTGVRPAVSTDGRTWRTLPPLRTHALPAGKRDGWFHDRLATVHVRTRHASVFGLLTQPRGVGLALATPERLNVGRARSLAVVLQATRPARLVLTLGRGGSTIARFQHVLADRSVTRLTLLLPPAARVPGRYRITVTASAQRFHSTRSASLSFVRR